MGTAKAKDKTMKTPQELAEEYSLSLLPDPRDARLLCSERKDFLAGYQAAAPQWISVKNKLPEHNTYVLVTDGSEVHRSKVWQEFFDMGPVTHWMPLPKPPEGEK